MTGTDLFSNQDGPEPEALNGARIWRGLLDDKAQQALVETLRGVVQRAPLVAPVTPGGRPMSVRMTAAGKFGWVSDRSGYRYADRHPSGMAWPPIPDAVLGIWSRVSGCRRPPECCLINFYGEGARMGLHQDRDEADFDCPVVSVSLGDPGLFRVGGTERRTPTASTWLMSGDVAVLAGAARLAWHGVDRIRFGASGLLPRGGRINLTLRVVT
ncbi:MAG: alpha-ketoglutarate-dependent dioxygenase AlkB family protein [Alkalilacustris sp.]